MPDAYLIGASSSPLFLFDAVVLVGGEAGGTSPWFLLVP